MNNIRRSLSFELDDTGRLTSESATRYFSRFGAFAAVIFLIRSITTSAIDLLCYIFLGQIYYHPIFRQALSFIPLYCIALPLSLVILRPLPTDAPTKEKMPPEKLLLGFCICIALLMAGNSISQGFFTFLFNNFGFSTSNPVAVSTATIPWWLNLLTTVILAPVLEELVFRKLVCDKLNALGEGFAIILSASFFSLFHQNFYQLFYSFFIGAFLAFIYLRTGNIIYTTLYHTGVNFLSAFVAPMILRMIDMNDLANPNNYRAIIMLLAYEGVMLVMTVVGLVILFKKYREFKPRSGLLPPPRRFAGPLFLNFGVACALALFTLSLISSLA